MAASGVVQSRLVQSYQTRLRPVTPADAALLHELAIAVRWPHRAEDLARFIAAGDGLLAADAIGRPIGAVMWFHVGANMASIGMLMTVPSLQAAGLGRWLMEQAMLACAGRQLRLVATRESWRLHLDLGFKPVGIVTRFGGHPTRGAVRRAAAQITAEMRPFDEAMRQAFPEMDAMVNAYARAAQFSAILGDADGLSAWAKGKFTGCAVMRPFGRGHVCGPIIASDASVAADLVTGLLARSDGGYHRVDLLRGEDEAFDPHLLARLDRLGLQADRDCIYMTLGAAPPVFPSVPADLRQYALLSQSLT